jgi:hypothetical protein
MTTKTRGDSPSELSEANITHSVSLLGDSYDNKNPRDSFREFIEPNITWGDKAFRGTIKGTVTASGS